MTIDTDTVARSNLVLLKQYVNDSSKPAYLALGETLQITLAGSLAFVVALAWNDVIKQALENSLTKFETGMFRLMYAVCATIILFVFNISVNEIISTMRKKAQKDATLIHQQKKRSIKLNDKISKGTVSSS